MFYGKVLVREDALIFDGKFLLREDSLIFDDKVLLREDSLIFDDKVLLREDLLLTYSSISSKKSSRKYCVFLRKFAAVSACAKSDAIWFQPWKHEAYFGKIWVMKPHNTQRKNFCFPKLLKICQKILLHDSCYLLQK